MATSAVCHDAGAANIVIADLLHTGRRDWRACMQGPAAKSWAAAFPGVKSFVRLDDVLEGCELMMTGSGWASDLEHQARKRAKAMGIHSVAIIDHWVNYAERFIRDGETVWPDEFWVTDEYAEAIAAHTFPGQIVRRVPNRYLESQLETIQLTRSSQVPLLLYLLEPTRNDWGRGVAGEFQALDYFFDHLSQLDIPRDTPIRLRLHPSETPEKYDAWIARHHDLDIALDDADNVGTAIGRSTWVVGCETSALALALQAGKTVYTSLPPWAPACRLPHQDLIHLARQNF